MNSRPKPGRWLRFLPLVPLVIGIAVFAVLAAQRGDGDGDELPVEIRSNAPAYQSLGALVAASDLVVVGEVTGVAPGRTISAPDDPTNAFVTQYVELRVDEVLHGEAGDSLVVEEVATLADGTAVVVDGQPTSASGDRVLLFLTDSTAGTVGDGADERIAMATVNGQSRYELSPTGEIVGPTSVLPVDWTVDELRQVAAACARLATC